MTDECTYEYIFETCKLETILHKILYKIQTLLVRHFCFRLIHKIETKRNLDIEFDLKIREYMLDLTRSPHVF